MQRPVLILGVLMVVAAAAEVAAQQVAFPGAEGAAMFATGGRGSVAAPGDVYHVTSLNNSGEGSLRDGITTAPAAGRTIVFDVAGTIHLTSRLTFSGKSNITIAGQTAPAGGITIANHEFTINNSSNIIVQHLRFRTGDRFPATHAPAPIPTYDPDVIGITNSNNVMIDHVTASWGVDESVSVTSNSHLVTVQWSTISQGLFNANHSALDDGVGHSFGSLLNGGTYSFHHNLYTHSKSRHPRAQDNGQGNLRLDWVNNVIYNPGIEFGNSDGNDVFGMNIVGNYGIRGPQTSATAMMNPDFDGSMFYVDGNYMDTDRDLVLDGNPVNGNAVFTSGDKTIVGARFDINGTPEVTTYSAQQAYIQVLSRAGASNYRDSIDRRTIRTVFNHLPGHIETQNDWGGWPTLPTGSAPLDSNGDGVPDTWADERGFDPLSSANAHLLNRQFTPSGFTFLEEYLHTLTPNAYAPIGTVSHSISTGFGRGADAQVDENGGLSATSSGNGSGATLDAVWGGTGGSTNQAIVLKFDLSQVVPGSVTDARLDLTAADAISGTHNFMVYGLEQDTSGWDWDESTVEFDGAPGLVFDGNSRTLGIDNTFTTTSHPDNPNVLSLGQVSIASAAAGGTVSLANPNLAAFLNLAAYYQGEESGELVTLILQQTNDATMASFYSKEGDAMLAPRLVIDALLASAPILAGDYNDDGVVDAADYTLWRDNLGAAAGTLANDADGGQIGPAQYNSWVANFGATGPGDGVGSVSGTTVPEPATVVLLLLGGLFWWRLRRSADS